MANETHYKYFKDLYDEESKRSIELNDSAKVNTGLVALYGAFITLTVSSPDSRWFDQLLFICAIVTLFGSLFISLYATNISEYEVPNFPSAVLETLPDYDDDEEFFSARVIDFTVACDANAAINHRKAMLLKLARILLLIGVAFHFGYSAVRVLFGGVQHV